jgi:hypothetical protein
LLVIELVPQHREAVDRPRGLFVPASLGGGSTSEAVRPDEGLTFSRLMVRMSAQGSPSPVVPRDRASSAKKTSPLPPSPEGYAYLLIPERPGVDWHDLVGPRAESDDKAPHDSSPPPLAHDTAPGPGQVVRAGAHAAASTSASGASAQSHSSDAGPAAPAIPTLGEALFGRERGPVSADGEESSAPEAAARPLVVLIPRVPPEYRLLAPITPGNP